MYLSKLRNNITTTVIIAKFLVILLLGLLFVAGSYTKEDFLGIIYLLLPVFVIYILSITWSAYADAAPSREASLSLYYLSLVVLLCYIIAVVAMLLYRHNIGSAVTSKIKMGIGIAEILLAVYLSYAVIKMHNKKIDRYKN